MARWGATPVGFVASIAQPGVKESGLDHEQSRVAWREHRLVVDPTFQVCNLPPRNLTYE